ncbi:16439_t:CDS:1, partial [Dentiscutata heterogama]
SYTPTNSNHLHSTCLNIDKLIEESKALKNENIVLKNENNLLKSQILVVKEELDTYKNPGTYNLHLAFKYLDLCLPSTKNLQIVTENQTESKLFPL